MPLKTQIHNILQSELAPTDLKVEDQSHYHRVGCETHFKVVAVSNVFTPLNRIERHRHIHSLLGDILLKLHALTLHLYTPEEWARRGNHSPSSPPCRNTS